MQHLLNAPFLVALEFLFSFIEWAGRSSGLPFQLMQRKEKSISGYARSSFQLHVLMLMISAFNFNFARRRRSFEWGREDIGSRFCSLALNSSCGLLRGSNSSQDCSFPLLFSHPPILFFPLECLRSKRSHGWIRNCFFRQMDTEKPIPAMNKEFNSMRDTQVFKPNKLATVGLVSRAKHVSVRLIK